MLTTLFEDSNHYTYGGRKSSGSEVPILSGRGGGGVTARRTCIPPSFPGSRSQKGGRTVSEDGIIIVIYQRYIWTIIIVRSKPLTVYTVLPRCYALLAVTPPPPIFG